MELLSFFLSESVSFASSLLSFFDSDSAVSALSSAFVSLLSLLVSFFSFAFSVMTTASLLCSVGASVSFRLGSLKPAIFLTRRKAATTVTTKMDKAKSNRKISPIKFASSSTLFLLFGFFFIHPPYSQRTVLPPRGESSLLPFPFQSVILLYP